MYDSSRMIISEAQWAWHQSHLCESSLRLSTTQLKVSKAICHGRKGAQKRSTVIKVTAIARTERVIKLM